MGQESSILKINIYGTEYPIKSDAETDSDYIRMVAEYVDKKMQEIDRTSTSKSSLRVAILAALNIADELFQERGSKTDDSKVESRIRLLSERIERALNE